jgi:AraC-like DNA-binding protein
MSPPKKLEALREQFGDLDELFLNMLNEHQTVEKVAHELGVSARTITRYTDGRFERRCKWHIVKRLFDASAERVKE